MSPITMLGDMPHLFLLVVPWLVSLFDHFGCKLYKFSSDCCKFLKKEYKVLITKTARLQARLDPGISTLLQLIGLPSPVSFDLFYISL